MATGQRTGCLHASLPLRAPAGWHGADQLPRGRRLRSRFTAVGPFISEAIPLGVGGSNHRSHATALSRSSRCDIAAASVDHHPESLLGRRSSRACVLHVRTHDSRRSCRSNAASPGMLCSSPVLWFGFLLSRHDSNGDAPWDQGLLNGGPKELMGDIYHVRERPPVACIKHVDPSRGSARHIGEYGVEIISLLKHQLTVHAVR